MALDPSSPYAQLSDVVYFQHRLKIANTASDLSASVKFDIARSPLPTQPVQDAVNLFGAPAQGNGWGLASFLDHVVSTQPDTMKVDDLAKLQENLVRGGYLPSTFQSTGEWSPEASAAFKQFEYDQHSEFYSGNHPLATSDANAVSFLGWTLPSAVFQGLVGAAKGFVEQAPETVGRVGLLGGVVAGAAMGAPFGGVPGAVVGGVIGGVSGFFGDLLSHDPTTEEDLAGSSTGPSSTPTTRTRRA